MVSSSSEATRVRVTSFSSPKFVVLFKEVYGAHVNVPEQSSDLFWKKTCCSTGEAGGSLPFGLSR